MTLDEFQLLISDTVQQQIARYKDADPLEVALKLPAHGSLISSQIKYLQRAKTKLPSYWEAGCILPPLCYEQSSSEQSAALKRVQGELCVDLTCGLGVDALYLSKGSKRVIALERDPVLATIAIYNFERLGVTNIEVINTSAEEFLTTYSGRMIELIYLDPARRGTRGEKLFRLEDCSPNALEIMPRLREIGRKIVIKCSPLFDVEEVFRLFGELAQVEVVSIKGECKEVLIELSTPSSQSNKPTAEYQPGGIRITAHPHQSLHFTRHFGSEKRSIYQLSHPLPLQTQDTPPEPPWNYLLIPDVALYKARLVEVYAQAIGVWNSSATGYCFCRRLPEHFVGTVYRIKELLPYHPKNLKSRLKAAKIKRCTLLKKDFPHSTEQITKAIGVTEGGSTLIAFTRIGEDYWAILLDTYKEQPPNAQ